MNVTLLGLGGGAPENATVEAWDALESAELVIGAMRLLDTLPEVEGQRRFAAVRAEEIAALLSRESAESACVVMSGDTGFYSGAKGLLPLLGGHDCRVLPGVSAVQILAARLGRPWQDWTLRSAHGVDCDPTAAIMRGKPTFFLTGGSHTPATICQALTDAGLGEIAVTVGENLTYPEEQIIHLTAAEAAERDFAPLSVLLTEAAPLPDAPAGGLADELFTRGNVPMTKQEVRAAVRSKLALQRGDTVWDVGAGTGSVSVELALTADEGRVYAVERDGEALALIEENRRRFGAWNIHVVPGAAPEALRELPAPDAVFIGGSKGNLRAIVDAALEKNPSVRLCMTAIALETLGAALEVFRDMETEITQLSVSRAKCAGELHLLLANNPVFLITAMRRQTT